MYGADYAWILHHDTVVGRPWWWEWWRTKTADCAVAQVVAAAENVLIVASYNRMVGGYDREDDDDDGGDGGSTLASSMRSLSGLVSDVHGQRCSWHDNDETFLSVEANLHGAYSRPHIV